MKYWRVNVFATVVVYQLAGLRYSDFSERYKAKLLVRPQLSFRNLSVEIAGNFVSHAEPFCCGIACIPILIKLEN